MYQINENFSIEYYSNSYHFCVTKRHVEFPLRGHYSNSRGAVKFDFYLRLPNTKYIAKKARIADRTGVIGSGLLQLIKNGIMQDYEHIEKAYIRRAYLISENTIRRFYK